MTIDKEIATSNDRIGLSPSAQEFGLDAKNL